MTLDEIIDNLNKIDDLTWGRYDLSVDLLHNKIKKEDIDSLVIGAMNCGKELALKLKENNKVSSPKELAEAYKITININSDYRDAAGRLVFALFTPPKKIQIMEEPLLRSRVHTKALKEEYKNAFTKDNIAKLLTAHELFHYFEEEYKKTIYTKKTKIVLWKIGKLKYTSTIRNLSEIAAMSFAKELTSFPFSPYLVDYILLWDYSRRNTMINYNDILTFANETNDLQLETISLTAEK